MIKLKNEIYKDIINDLCFYSVGEDSLRNLINFSNEKINSVLNPLKVLIGDTKDSSYKSIDYLYGFSVFTLKNSNKTYLSIFFNEYKYITQEEINFLFNIVRIISQFIDRKEKENNSKLNYKELLDQASDSIFVSDLNGKLVEFNRKSLELLGYSVEEMYRLNISDILSLRSMDKLQEVYQELMSGKTIFRQAELVTKYGKTIYIESTAKLLNNKYVQSIVRDITERRKMEENLKESEERFRCLSESAFEAIIITDNKGIIIDANQAFSKISLYTIDEIIGQYSYLMVPEKYRKELYIIFENEYQYPYELQLNRKDGKEVTVEIRVRKTSYHGKSVRVTVIRDISSYKEAEEQIRKALKEKEILLKEIHHRVKNNLQIVSSLLYLQSKYVEDEKSLEVFRESQNRIKSMAFIHEKLYQSKNFDKVDFSDYVSNLLKNLFYSYGLKDQIKAEINTENIMLNMNYAIPCGLIISELIANSIKYAFPEDKIKYSNKKINVSLKNENELFLLSVSDNGQGLSENIDISKTETLGLQLVQLLTAQMNGNLEIKNNNGLTFKISFKNNIS